MFKEIECPCGQTMRLCKLKVRKGNDEYWVEAEYKDDSHVANFAGEFNEEELRKLVKSELMGKTK